MLRAGESNMLANVTVDRSEFTKHIETLSGSAIDRIALAHPDLFQGLYRVSATDAEPLSEKPAAKRPAPTVDFATVKALALGCATAKPGQRAEEVAKAIGHDGLAVKRALTALAKDGVLIVEGERRAARYSPKVAA
jgi:hypothetical protein